MSTITVILPGFRYRDDSNGFSNTGTMLDQTTTHLAVGIPSPAAKGPVSILGRKIWLPRLVYACLPWFYVGSGIAAFLGTLYINEWFWVLPHYLLFSAACIHLGIFVAAKRRSAAKRNGQTIVQDS